jgi:nucleoside-diphosphate-sugar epimerase
LARALIVGCGCRGRTLGKRLTAAGWLVRGTSRREAGRDAAGEAGLEGVTADPDMPGSVLDHVGDVTVVVWLLGSASGDPDAVAAIHGPRLERLLEKLVDTPVRGVVYEGAGTAGEAALGEGASIVAAASGRWRIPAEIVTTDPEDRAAWLDAMAEAVTGVAG